MGLIALLLALLLEQLRPRPLSDRPHRAAAALADAVQAKVRGPAAWILLAGAAAVVWLLDGWLQPSYPGLVFIAHVVILYYTIGFRRLGDALALIRSALVAEEPAAARDEFARWLAGIDADAESAAALEAYRTMDERAADRRDASPFQEAGSEEAGNARAAATDLAPAGSDADGDTETETTLSRAAGAAALLAMHRHLFAPLFWYLLLPGVSGPVLYRVLAVAGQRWNAARQGGRVASAAVSALPKEKGPDPFSFGASATGTGEREKGSDPFSGPGPSGAPAPGAFSPGAWPPAGAAGITVRAGGPADRRLRDVYARALRALQSGRPGVAARMLVTIPAPLVAARALYWADWPAVHFSAAGFAIMGNFEDVLYCWRSAVAAGTGDDTRALLLAAGSGALGVRLADAALEARWAGAAQSFEWAAPPADSRTLRAVVGLVWRAAALWIGLFGLLTVAGWLGR